MTQEGFIDGGNEVCSEARLFHIAEPAFRKACAHIFRILVHREEDKLNCGKSCVDLVGGFDPIEDRHGYVQNDEIGLQPLRFANESSSVIDCSDQIKIRLQDRRHAVQKEVMVVRKQNSRRSAMRSRPCQL